MEEVYVDFPIYDAKARSLKHSVLDLAIGGSIGLRRDRRVFVRALNNVSLTFREGDRVALIGHNGAGKTTLLRVVAGIYEPTRGHINCRGRVTTLSNITLGMNVDCNGYENIRMRGTIMGLSPREIKEKTRDIADFSELGTYLDMPLRSYSTGMRLRLAFSISTAMPADILLLDEWIGAGDYHFVSRAEERMKKVLDRAGILLLASHNEELIGRVCNRAILMQNGEVAADGDVMESLRHYYGTPPRH